MILGGLREREENDPVPEGTDAGLQGYRFVYRTILDAGIVTVLALSLCTSVTAAESAGNSAARAIQTVPGMPPVIDPNNLYSETQAGKLSPTVKDALRRGFLSQQQTKDGTGIDPATYKEGGHFPVRGEPP